MDAHFELNGVSFVWDEKKALSNTAKHGITFECAAEVFFDPFVRVVDASRNGETRDAAVGYDRRSRLLFVVHVLFEDDTIRLVSARRATTEERNEHDS